MKVACTLAQAFALMIRSSDAPALEDWLQEASQSEIAELRTFAAGIKRDQAAVLAARMNGVKVRSKGRSIA